MKLIFVSAPLWAKYPAQIEANIARTTAIGAMINQAGKGEHGRDKIKNGIGENEKICRTR